MTSPLTGFVLILNKQNNASLLCSLQVIREARAVTIPGHKTACSKCKVVNSVQWVIILCYCSAAEESGPYLSSSAFGTQSHVGGNAQYGDSQESLGDHVTERFSKYPVLSSSIYRGQCHPLGWGRGGGTQHFMKR